MVFEAIKQHVAQNPSLVKKIKAIFQWNITEGGKTVAQWSMYHGLLVYNNNTIKYLSCQD